jgi:hypothetical protein
MRRTALALLALAATLAAPRSSAITITNVFDPTPPGWSVTEMAVVAAASARWEVAFAGPLVVTLTWRKSALPVTRLGQASSYVTTGAGNTGLPVSATIDVNTAIVFFVDPTPTVNEEFQKIVSPPWLLPAVPLGAADGFYDLYTLASHEIGHALGFSSGFGDFAAKIAPSPTTPQWVYAFLSTPIFGHPVIEYFAGFFPFGGVYMPASEDDAEEGGSLGGLPSHIDDTFGGGLDAGTFTIDLMSPTMLVSERRLISFVDKDILGDAMGYTLTGVPGLGPMGVVATFLLALGFGVFRLRRNAARS